METAGKRYFLNFSMGAKIMFFEIWRTKKFVAPLKKLAKTNFVSFFDWKKRRRNDVAPYKHRGATGFGASVMISVLAGIDGFVVGFCSILTENCISSCWKRVEQLRVEKLVRRDQSSASQLLRIILFEKNIKT